MKKRIILLLTICFCVLSGCKINENSTVVLTAGFANDEVFYIEHETCKKEEFEIYLINMKNQYGSTFGNEIFEVSNNGITLEDTLKDQVLEKLASVKIMNLLSEQKGISLTDEELANVENAANAYYSGISPKEKEKLNIDYDLVFNMYKELAIAKKGYNYLIADINPEISDDEARIMTVSQIYIKTYFTNENGERESISDIALSEAKNKIDTAKEYLDEGQDFNKVASEFTEAENVTVSFGKGEKEEKYETVAFSLGKGEVSDIFKTDEGYYIIKCLTTFNKEETDRNKIRIVEEKRKVVFEEEYNSFTKTLMRKINQEIFDEIQIPQDDELTSDSFFRNYETYINN